MVGLTDNHMARARLSPLAAVPECLAYGVEPVVHVSCRDRNWLGLQQQVASAAALGASGILVVAGDRHPRLSPATVRATEVMAHVAEWTAPRNLALGAVVNPFAERRRELGLLRRKLDSGITFLQTQMVFDLDRLDDFLAAGAGIIPSGFPLFVSVGLIRSARSLKFVLESLPDCPIPPHLVDSIRAGGGVAVASEMAARLAERPEVRMHLISLGAERHASEIVSHFTRARRSPPVEAALSPGG